MLHSKIRCMNQIHIERLKKVTKFDMLNNEPMIKLNRLKSR